MDNQFKNFGITVTTNIFIYQIWFQSDLKVCVICLLLHKSDILLISVELVFKDKCTPTPFVEEFPEDDGEAERAALSDHIYMDAMGFGMGNCCLQVQNTDASFFLFIHPLTWTALNFVCLRLYGVPK